MKPKVLVSASTLPLHRDDPEPRFIADFAESLAKDYEVHVIAPWAPDAEKYEYRDGYHIYRYQYWPQSWKQLAGKGGIVANLKSSPSLVIALPFFFLAQLLCLLKIAYREKIWLLHAHWVIPQGLCALLAKTLTLGKLDYIVTLHGGDHFVFEHGLGRKLKHLILKYARNISCVSSAIKQDLVKVNPRLEISVIPMGLHVEQFLCQQHKDRKGIVFVGRLVEKKGVIYLLEAMKILAEKGYKEPLNIIGTGPLETTIIEYIQQHKLNKTISLLGFQSHERLPKLLEQHRISVIPSVAADSGDQEGFGLTVIESMTAGCAVIVSDSPVFNDVVEAGVTGLVSQQKSPESIAERLMELIDNEEVRRKVARAGQSRCIERYDWQAISMQYQKLYQ